MIGRAIVPLFFDLPANAIETIYENPTLPENSGPLKLIQLFNGIGLFIVPSIVYLFLFERDSIKKHLLGPQHISSFLLIVFIFFSSFQLIGILAKWNEAIEFPSLFNEIESWMQASEARAIELTEGVLQMQSIADLLFTFFLIALIPAVGEELIFRGIIQSTINKGRTNKHIGVWVSAILFSAMHLQFYGFFPRMFLGAMFGYLFLWSGNLWLPIFAHFLNNGFAVLTTYWLGKDQIEKELKHDHIDYAPFTVLFSLAVFFTMLYVFRKYHSGKGLPFFNR